MKRKVIGAILGLPAAIALYNLLVFLECLCVYHKPFVFGWQNIVFPLIGWVIVVIAGIIFRTYHKRKKEKEQQHRFYQ